MEERKTFNLFCDESSHLPHDEMPYMLIGYVQVGSNDIRLYKEELRKIKLKHKKKGETKWSGVSESALPFFEELLNFFFDSSMSFRAVIVDKSQIDELRPDFTYDDFNSKKREQIQPILHRLEIANDNAA